jgi:hypothetical protein
MRLLAFLILPLFLLPACQDTGPLAPASSPPPSLSQPLSRLPAGYSNRCVKIYSEALYRGTAVEPGSWVRRPKPASFEDRDLRLATAFAVESGGRRYLVTASHAVWRSWAEGEAVARPHPQGTLQGGTLRIRVSSLAYAPERIYVLPAEDLAVLAMPADFWKKVDLLTFSVPPGLPPLEQGVRVWGFPGTSAPDLRTDARVVGVSEGMIELNRPLDPGFSGGPVIRLERDELLGVVLRSTDRQARVLPAGRIAQALEVFEVRAVSCGETLELAR